MSRKKVTSTRLGCSKNKRTFYGFKGWYEIQSHILKHVYCRFRREIWEDIFDKDFLQEVRDDLRNEVSCPSRGKEANDISEKTCSLCKIKGNCYNSAIQAKFRELILEKIIKSVENDKNIGRTEKKGLHVHFSDRYDANRKVHFLDIVSDDGMLIGFSRMNDHNSYGLETFHIPAEFHGNIAVEYLLAKQEGRPGVIKRTLLSRYKKEIYRPVNGAKEYEDLNIHYECNFLCSQ